MSTHDDTIDAYVNWNNFLRHKPRNTQGKPDQKFSQYIITSVYYLLLYYLLQLQHFL